MRVIEKYEEIMNIILPTLMRRDVKLIVRFYLCVQTGRYLKYHY